MFLARLPGESPCFSRVQITQSLILNRVGSILIYLSPYGPKRNVEAAEVEGYSSISGCLNSRHQPPRAGIRFPPSFPGVRKVPV